MRLKLLVAVLVAFLVGGTGYDDSVGTRLQLRSIATNTATSGPNAEGGAGAAPYGPVNSSNYVFSTPAGEYVGQSSKFSQRVAQHVANGKFTQAEVDLAQRFAVQGTKLDREVAEQLLIDSKGGIDNLLNKVNPIGPNRFGVMPNQPYAR